LFRHKCNVINKNAQQNPQSMRIRQWH